MKKHRGPWKRLVRQAVDKDTYNRSGRLVYAEGRVVVTMGGMEDGR